MMNKLGRLLGLALLAVVAATANAQDYPTKAIKIVVPYAPGGATDVIARALAQKLGEAWHQSVIVENKPGAGGAIGADYVARAPADGATILMAINGTLYAKLNSGTPTKLDPVTLVAVAPNVIAANTSLPANDVKQLIALAKAKPGEITYGSAGNGSASHLAGALFANLAGVDMTHVPYKGVTPAVNDLLGGQIKLSFAVYSVVDPLVKSGRLKALAVTSAKRSPQAPDLPTVAEGGLKGYDVVSWFGLLVPAGTPRSTIDKIQAEVSRIVNLPDVKATFTKQGIEFVGSKPEAFADFMKEDWRVWDRLIKATGITLE
jgi:tripartite-type tricarboxylate transporter receptor subunit TctC